MSTKPYRVDNLDGGIEIRHWKYESGLTEISAYVPECLPGAGPILVAVASRRGDAGTGAKWTVSGGREVRSVTALKTVALARLESIALAEFEKRRPIYARDAANASRGIQS